MEKEDIRSLQELKAFAERFVKEYSNGAVVGLIGELGAGKTTFVRFCVQIICDRMNRDVPRVTSPSFVLHQSYKTLNPPIEHFDLYRMSSVTDEMLTELGYFEAMEENRMKKGLVFIEWPDRVTDQRLLECDIVLQFTLKGNQRTIQY